ncbi:MAG: imidazole glycerol phosphate synthase subunit HisH [Proteobacteria bacterium]|nr:imidazole glycerol phosphate synthase subunit HisH [Pseudomonadota bacterium]MBU1389494.1 imidazole glycerol phosphate synthase subunit HisH [Pseudomonadota bacterium]MBU1541314.1 imidazole glycerol phosphate synthase subunit HisH [Pseudomonadota bacterium]MBU2481728.1 imidazole glycerol phosphate synthase subunit HisH [Pseudomonadota bacterium]
MNKDYKIAVIDYQMSNMFSIKNALDRLGYENEVTSDYKKIMSAQGAVLPGVGSFPDAMENIKALNLAPAIKDFISNGKPFMGICLGLQLLFSASEEFGHTKGLGIIEGTVRNFKSQPSIERIPHVGWNQIKKMNLSNEDSNDHRPLDQIMDNEYFYFVHSYFVCPENEEDILTTTTYDDFEFCSSVLSKNVFASQFHPEKSGDKGLKILTNFFK